MMVGLGGRGTDGAVQTYKFFVHGDTLHCTYRMKINNLLSREPSEKFDRIRNVVSVPPADDHTGTKVHYFLNPAHLGRLT